MSKLSTKISEAGGDKWIYICKDGVELDCAKYRESNPIKSIISAIWISLTPEEWEFSEKSKELKDINPYVFNNKDTRGYWRTLNRFPNYNRWNEALALCTGVEYFNTLVEHTFHIQFAAETAYALTSVLINLDKTEILDIFNLKEK